MTKPDAGQCDNVRPTHTTEKPRGDLVRVHTAGSRATVSQRVVAVVQSDKAEAEKPRRQFVRVSTTNGRAFGDQIDGHKKRVVGLVTPCPAPTPNKPLVVGALASKDTKVR